jgi:carbamoyltransferase
MSVLGISAYYHDSAAALVGEGRVLAAAQEERFTRRKHDARFPSHAVAACLGVAGLPGSGVDAVVFYDQPWLKFKRLWATFMAFAPEGREPFCRAMGKWLGGRLGMRRDLRRHLMAVDSSFEDVPIVFGEHHHSHAASAFLASPFEEAAVLTVDGVGEWATTTVGVGSGARVTLEREIHFPHSLGLLYSAFTSYLGFKVNSGEYKLMGLAPYGKPKFKKLILSHLIDVKEDGSFRLDIKYFGYCTGFTMTNDRFHDLFGASPRRAEEPVNQWHMDMAASIQAVTEEVMLLMGRSVLRETRQDSLCLAGGVALNCVANGKLLRESGAKRLWVQPAAGDAGGALGAALGYYWEQAAAQGKTREAVDIMEGSYLGPNYSQAEIETRLSRAEAVFEVMSPEAMLEVVATALAAGRTVGWFQGRMEFGPRALGNRSILADPRCPKMQRRLNLKIKNRESFRPFAPAVLREEVDDWFELDADSPYMQLVAPVNETRRSALTPHDQKRDGFARLDVSRSAIPAVTHVDNSARVQTVHRETNPLFHGLLRKFHTKTGCPVLINTSFNVRGEPIVCTPEDAFRCFMGTDLDLLVVGNCVLEKTAQTVSESHEFKQSFALD